jgi:hypothetical protein
MWFRTIKIRKEWVERGETIIPTTFKQHIGGATERRDQPGWTNNRSFSPTAKPIFPKN